MRSTHSRCPQRGSGTLDRSNGYEGISAEFLAGRGSVYSSGVGCCDVRDWVRTLPPRSTVLDIGCGSGIPITQVMIKEGMNVYAVDAAPSMVAAFRGYFPNVPVACEAIQDSPFFNRKFDGVLAWGLMFLLTPEDQRLLIKRIAEILVPGGSLMFTSPDEPLTWNDAMTELETRSLGAVEYRRLLQAAGLTVIREHSGEGGNYHFSARRNAG